MPTTSVYLFIVYFMYFQVVGAQTNCNLCCSGDSAACNFAFKGTPGQCCGFLSSVPFCCPTNATSYCSLVSNPSSYRCFPCPSNCLQCSTGGICAICARGFYSSGGGCSTCSTGCADCSSPNQCNTCQTGYIKNSNNLCSPCSYGCSSCSMSFNNCTGCMDGFVLNGTKCLAVPTSDNGSNVGVIIGMVIGVILFLLLLWFIVRKCCGTRNPEQSAMLTGSSQGQRSDYAPLPTSSSNVYPAQQRSARQSSPLDPVHGYADATPSGYSDHPAYSMPHHPVLGYQQRPQQVSQGPPPSFFQPPVVVPGYSGALSNLSQSQNSRPPSYSSEPGAAPGYR